MIGDIGADVAAARAAGMPSILVPTDVTRPEEIEAAPRVAPTLLAAVESLLAPAPSRPETAPTPPACRPDIPLVLMGARRLPAFSPWSGAEAAR
jgi:hypothetical protein